MAVIHLGEPRPVSPPRRFTLDVPGMLALQRALDGDGLPADIRVEVSEVSAQLAGVDLEQVVAEAADRLRAHGVLGADGAPIGPVAANLQGMSRAPRRIRTTYGGPVDTVLGYHWVGPELGGSLVRDGERFELSMFDARSFGDELLRLLPGQTFAESDRRAMTLAVEDFAALTAIEDEIVPGQVGPVADFLGLDPALLGAVHTWAEGFRGVLHCTASDTDESRLPKALVWVCERTGWWSVVPLTRRDGTRTVTLTPREAKEITADLGYLVSGAWT